MHTRQSAFLDYRQATRPLRGLPERQQITTLKYELLYALERVNDYQARSGDLESRVAELDAQLSVRENAQDAFARHLHAELGRTETELADTRREHEVELHELRMELLSVETQCEDLDELCRSLAGEDDIEPRTQPASEAPEAQVSAS